MIGLIQLSMALVDDPLNDWLATATKTSAGDIHATVFDDIIQGMRDGYNDSQ